MGGALVDQAMPLVASSHGYGRSSAAQVRCFGRSQRAAGHGVTLITARATTDPDSQAFWYHTDNCCDFWVTGVDDSNWISSPIAGAREVAAREPWLEHLLSGGWRQRRGQGAGTACVWEVSPFPRRCSRAGVCGRSAACLAARRMCGGGCRLA